MPIAAPWALPTLTAVALLAIVRPAAAPRVAAESASGAVQASSVAHQAAERSDLVWSAAVERHEIGQMDAPAKLLAAWSKDQLEEVGASVLAGLDAALAKAIPGSEDARRLHRLINRGVLLHTDIALSLQGKGPAGLSNVLLLADGRKQGLGNSLHVEFAAALLKLDASRRGKETARAWYGALSAYLLHAGRLGDVAMVLTLWREAALGERAVDPSAFPEDEDFLFDYGCLHEGLMAPGARVVLGDQFERPSSATGEYSGLERSGSGWTRRTTTFRTRSEEFAVHAEQAFRAYRKVVEMNPRAGEARVRLGHAECVRGNCGSGMRNLRAGAELAGGDPVVSYYAAMFLGQAEEARGRYEEARKDYERAAGLFPLAQSPLLALGALGDRSGDRQAAGRHARRLWALPADGKHRYDPWWDYDGGPRNGESLLREVYRLLEGGVDDRQ
jgi:tetratricopeptide (TPR) repeat protein